MPDTAARQAWMATLARAEPGALERLAPPLLPPWQRLRGPEIGLVMVQARAGGTGAPFNLGEATVARCTVQLESGEVGHAYRLGRDARAAELAAALDAALQDPARHPALLPLLATLAAPPDAAQAETARRAAATEVQFFTLATMRGA